jgi:TusA-related sulfurtransferase
MSTEVAAIAVDGGELPLGGGLLALVRPALDALEPDGILAVLSRSRSVREDLAAWCHSERHEYLGVEELSDDIDRHLIARSKFSVPSSPSNTGLDYAHDDEGKNIAVSLTEPLPTIADPFTGFAPRGARVEPGGPAYPFTLNQREFVAAARSCKTL